MLLSGEQKQLILDILRKENRRLWSRHRGKLLQKTIEDLEQALRNERVNAPKTKSDSTLDWGTRK